MTTNAVKRFETARKVKLPLDPFRMESLAGELGTLAPWFLKKQAQVSTAEPPPFPQTPGWTFPLFVWSGNQAPESCSLRRAFFFPVQWQARHGYEPGLPPHLLTLANEVRSALSGKLPVADYGLCAPLFRDWDFSTCDWTADSAGPKSWLIVGALAAPPKCLIFQIDSDNRGFHHAGTETLWILPRKQEGESPV